MRYDDTAHENIVYLLRNANQLAITSDKRTRARDSIVGSLFEALFQHNHGNVYN